MKITHREMTASQKICILLLTLVVKTNAECTISYEYDNSYLPIAQCVVTCTGYVDNNELGLINQREYRRHYGYASSEMKCRDGHSNLFIKTLIYKSESTSSLIPVMRGPYTDSVIDAVYSLDLSDNTYENTPSIMSMGHLHLLNMSMNHLTTAVLSNYYALGMLTEIDLSYNMINAIQVNSDQNIYQKLEKLDISHNRLEEIPEAIFESFDNLHVLNLSYNRIKTISPVTFEGTRQLIELNLSNNRLTSINTSLFRFSELEILNLSGNLISNLQPNDFEHLNKLQTLDLSINIIKVIDVNVFKMTTLLQALDLSNNLLATIDGDTFSNLQLLTNIDLSKNKIKSIPINLFKNNNISYFSISANRLEGSLIRGMFEGISVTRLDLSNQYLTEVNDYAFDDLDELQEIFLNLNSIKILSNKSFKTLKNLDYLDLSNNQITKIDFDKTDLINLRSLIIKNNLVTEIKYEELECLTNLEFLDISENRISQLKPNLFQSLKNLVNLKIHKNPLVGTLATGTFNGLILLPSLDISHTMLTIIQNASFTNMSKLQEVNMTDCEINELQYNAFIHTGHIEALDLSYNKLKDFSINSTELSMLSLLLLNNNFIKTIVFTPMEGKSRLNKIILSHNNLENISNETYYSLINLSYLDLSYNVKFNFTASMLNRMKKLNTLILSGIRTDINFKTNMNESYVTHLIISNTSICNISQLSLSNMVSLISVDLSFNNVSKLQLGDFDSLRSMKLLDLSYNKISYIQPGIFKQNELLVSLNISHNLISSISYGIFRGLISLQILDVSYNRLKELQNERFYEIIHLTELIVDFNQIDSINIEEFDGTSLTKLSIGNNPLPCQVLVKLSKLESERTFIITALRLDEHSNENVNGVVCNKDRNTRPILVSNSDGNTDDILKKLSNILESVGNENIDKDANDNKYLENISNILGKISEVLINNNRTNVVMLSKIIRSLENLTVTTKNVVTTPKASGTTITYATTRGSLIKDNYNVTPTIDIISYIGHVKGELENAMANEKLIIINEIERKLASNGNGTESFPISINHGKLFSNGDENKKYLFAETYVALILSISLVFIFIGLVLYRLYKNRLRRSFSISNHILPGAMDNSSL